MKFVKCFAMVGLVLAMVLLLTPSGCASKNTVRSVEGTPTVRVRLILGADRVTVVAQEPPTMSSDGGNNRKTLGLSGGQSAVLELNSGSWQMNGVTLGGGVLELFQPMDGAVSINGNPYRGKYRFVPVSDHKFDVMNDVDVDSYLMGVISRELLPGWHIEAYKAQAIIARTYALYEAKTNGDGRYWDLFTDERSQVYGGMNAETPSSISAVEQTRGYVAVYGPPGQEKIFKAYFSSCCGGVSVSPTDVFNEPSIPPLDAKYTGGVCSISPRYSWGPIVFGKAELARRIRAWGVKTGRSEQNIQALGNIEIASSNQFGRPRRFTITDNRGQAYSVTAEQMRQAINTDPNGGQTVYSGFFRPVDAGDNIQIVDGHGFGHGVGACQWCMQSRALSGESAVNIVLKAYPQSLVVPAY